MKPNNLSPIALFVYNRPEHTARTITALQKNILANDSDIFIFSDGARDELGETKVEEVRNYLKMISGFKNISIIERNENLGLSKSIISGVTEIVNKYGKVIVLEDDLITSPYFLKYMNEALSVYEKEEGVISIHGYVYPIKKTLPETFFLRGADCWGWATWKRGWDLFEPDGKRLLTELENRNLVRKFDFDGNYDYSGMLKRQIAGQNNSWAIRWYASAFLADKLTLYPGRSLIENVGQDKTGVHGTQSSMYKTTLTQNEILVGNIIIEENSEAQDIINNYFGSLKPGLIRRIVRKIRSFL